MKDMRTTIISWTLLALIALVSAQIHTPTFEEVVCNIGTADSCTYTFSHTSIGMVPENIPTGNVDDDDTNNILENEVSISPVLNQPVDFGPGTTTLSPGSFSFTATCTGSYAWVLNGTRVNATSGVYECTTECDDGNQCTNDIYDDGTGDCVNTAVVPATVCDQGLTACEAETSQCIGTVCVTASTLDCTAIVIGGLPGRCEPTAPHADLVTGCAFGFASSPGDSSFTDSTSTSVTYETTDVEEQDTSSTVADDDSDLSRLEIVEVSVTSDGDYTLDVTEITNPSHDDDDDSDHDDHLVRAGIALMFLGPTGLIFILTFLPTLAAYLRHRSM